jgi:hypothetical protein
MIYTLGYVRDLVAPYVLTGGSCPDAMTVRNRINEAVRRLLSEGRADWAQTQRKVRLAARNCLITLPREFESARLLLINQKPGDLLPSYYQYLENGPYAENHGEHYGIDLMDEGDGWPVFFDIPNCPDGPDYYLFAASTSESDKGLEILVTGRKKDGSEILQASGLPGHLLPISHWDGGSEGVLAFERSRVLSSVPFDRVSHVVLPPKRRGYVSFYAVNPENNAMFFLAKYHPDEEVPSYRRYRVLSGCPEEPTLVDMLCKVRYIPATRDDDVLLIQNPDAIKTMVMAIREENAGNVQSSVFLEEKANSQLARQTMNQRSGEPMLRVQDTFTIGSSAQII